jgi:pimeloyl-ACP methyl ester carboxylesterase
MEVASPRGARAQARAAARWTSLGRLSRIEAPTLVIHGAEDRIVPVANARLLARGIRGAALDVVRDAGHLLLDDAPARVGTSMARFLASVDQGGTARPGAESGRRHALIEVAGASVVPLPA